MIEFNVDGAPFDKMGNICMYNHCGHRVVSRYYRVALTFKRGGQFWLCSFVRVTYLCGDFLMMRRNWRAYLNPVTLSPDAIFVALSRDACLLNAEIERGSVIFFDIIEILLYDLVIWNIYKTRGFLYL